MNPQSQQGIATKVGNDTECSAAPIAVGDISDRPDLPLPTSQSETASHAATPLALLEHITSDSDRTGNAGTLLRVGAAALSRVILSIAAVLIGVAFLLGVVLHYTGGGGVIATSAVATTATGGVAGAAYLYRARRRRRRRGTSPRGDRDGHSSRRSTK